MSADSHARTGHFLTTTGNPPECPQGTCADGDFECVVGGLPLIRHWPWEYKAPFSPGDVIEEYVRPARLVMGGKVFDTAPGYGASEEVAGTSSQEAGIIQRVLFDGEQAHYQLVYGRTSGDLLIRVEGGEAEEERQAHDRAPPDLHGGDVVRP